ncbi:MAG: putative alpha/beta-hydrolase family hydrolase [Oleispira sp.]
MELIENGVKDGPVYIFAHGAGADMNSDFITEVVEKWSNKGIRVVRFNFPYMIKRAEDGKRRPPDRMPKLLAAYEAVIKQLNCPVVIGGKSMGGRISSMLLAENALRETSERLPILGSACLGFPFHAPKKDSKDRLDHLKELTQPLLIVQGTRDALGTQEEVNEYIRAKKINASIQLRWLEDGDHNLKPRKASGFSYQQHIDNAIDQTAEFVLKLHQHK